MEEALEVFTKINTLVVQRKVREAITLVTLNHPKHKYSAFDTSLYF